MSSKEIDYLMALNESGVITHEGAAADINNILEWFDTPVGSVYGRPGWGHDLIRLKHEPTGSTTTALHFEFSIINKLGQDLPHIQIDSIFCEPSPKEPDVYVVRIGLPSGELERSINL